jgi:hypothetical protein
VLIADYVGGENAFFGNKNEAEQNETGSLV